MNMLKDFQKYEDYIRKSIVYSSMEDDEWREYLINYFKRKNEDELKNIFWF